MAQQNNTLQLAGYAAFVNGGRRVEPRVIAGVPSFRAQAH